MQSPSSGEPATVQGDPEPDRGPQLRFRLLSARRDSFRSTTGVVESTWVGGGAGRYLMLELRAWMTEVGVGQRATRNERELQFLSISMSIPGPRVGEVAFGSCAETIRGAGVWVSCMSGSSSEKSFFGSGGMGGMGLGRFGVDGGSVMVVAKILFMECEILDFECGVLGATMLSLVKSSIGTKFTSQFGNLVADMALDATTTVGVDLGQGLREVDIKKYIKVEKVPGGQLEDSKVLKGVMFNKDVVAPGKMRRKIVNPRIILLDCPLEYKKGENQTNAELVKEEDWGVLLKMEEEYIESLCMQIIKFKPDLVITEKGLSDLACHYLSKAGISAIRRLRKTDNNRIAKACGAVIVNRPEELQESDVGTRAGLYEVKKIGDEFFSFIVDCKDPKACTVLLRGASKDLLNEVERNLQDAMSVARNIIKNPKLVPGGGASELTVSATLKQKSSSVEGIEKWPYEAAAVAFEAIPRTLAQNCGVNVIRTMTALQGKHANGENAWTGIDGNTGEITDMKERKIWDAYNVKAQTFKTAIEAASMLLRIDDIVSGIKKKQAPGSTQGPTKPQVEEEGDADNEQMIPE
ncbi:hypothetical protein MRB53_032520 [Persea americana]|uniref:Uncharacterized protein n=1 Tax=Persea americana TaxID=3435 RepID=A0ACC2KSL9_PERAE|nr:hypothetical protein MRB53_032520 [Persea americana]